MYFNIYIYQYILIYINITSYVQGRGLCAPGPEPWPGPARPGPVQSCSALNWDSYISFVGFVFGGSTGVERCDLLFHSKFPSNALKVMSGIPWGQSYDYFNFWSPFSPAPSLACPSAHPRNPPPRVRCTPTHPKKLELWRNTVHRTVLRQMPRATFRKD